MPKKRKSLKRSSPEEERIYLKKILEKRFPEGYLQIEVDTPWGKRFGYCSKNDKKAIKLTKKMAKSYLKMKKENESKILSYLLPEFMEAWIKEKGLFEKATTTESDCRRLDIDKLKVLVFEEIMKIPCMELGADPIGFADFTRVEVAQFLEKTWKLMGPIRTRFPLKKKKK